MWYAIKHYFLYQLKSLENHFNILKNRLEIERAYRTKGKIDFSRFFSRQTLIWSSIVTLGIALIISGPIYINKISQNIKEITGLIQNKRKLINSRQKLTKSSKKSSAYAQSKIPLKKPKIVQSIRHDKSRDSLAEKYSETSAPDISLFSEFMHYFILINKANKKMYILHKTDNKWSLFNKYDVAIGEHEGKKAKAGDKRTPEGLYFIIGRKEKSELHKMYGPLAFVLNYPNAEDRKAGRTGVGIWIHGTNPDSLPLNTNGCIELENSNIKEIGSYLKNGIGTPVYIFDNDNLIDPVTFPNYRKAELKRKYVLSQYEKQRHFFISLLKKWEEAWESKDIDIYSEFYHTKKFFGQGLKWDKWKEKKSRTFEIYDTINISTNKIYLADFSETTAILKFEQEYKSDLLHVVNGKKLNFIKSMGKWKIYGENTFPKEELLL